MFFRYLRARMIFVMLLSAASCAAAGPARAQTAPSQTTPSQTTPSQAVPAPERPRRHVNTPPQQQVRERTAGRKDAAKEADEDQVERIDTDLTGIILTAVDKNRRFVKTLRQEDLRVLEDGVPQQILSFQRETDLPLSLAILIDTSASQKGVMPDEKAAAGAFVDAVMRPGKDSAAVLSFTGLVRGEQLMTSEVAKIREAIERVRVEFGIDSPECSPDYVPATEEERLRCYTGVWDAVGVTVDKILSRTPESTRRAIILLSDGDDTISRSKTAEAADFAVRHNVVVYSIGIRDEDFPRGELDRDALRKVSERTGGRAFFPENREQLRAAFDQIEDELRSQYLLAYSPSNKGRDGAYRKVQVEITNPELRRQKLRLLYRQGYFARETAEGVAPPISDK